MREYEIMFIVKPTLGEDEVKNVVKSFTKVLTDNGAKIASEKEMGQRDLAYEIKKHKAGYYFLLVVEAPVEAINEFNRIVNISDTVIRALVTKIEK